jgi:hypothetical protein
MGIKFETSLDDQDYGLIVCGKTGALKGIFIPEGLENQIIPEPVAKICLDYFNIDPNEEEEVTLH